MFSEKLSASLQRILGLRNLNYETASELCHMSSRHFGNIARGDTSPTLNVFENLCIGLGKTPNELLGYPSDEALSFRHPMPIAGAYYFDIPKHPATYAVCPDAAAYSCGITTTTAVTAGKPCHGTILIWVKSRSPSLSKPISIV